MEALEGIHVIYAYFDIRIYLMGKREMTILRSTVIYKSLSSLSLVVIGMEASALACHAETYYIYIFIYSFIYIHIHTHTYIHTYIHSFIHSFIHTYIHTYIHYIHVCLLYIYIYIYIYVAAPGRKCAQENFGRIQRGGLARGGVQSYSII